MNHIWKITPFAVLVAASLAACPGGGSDGSGGSAPCKALETPCAGGELLTKNAYSECCNGFWHSVEDDTYSCPPGGAVTTFRVADDPTSQPCTGGSSSSSSGGDGGVIPGCMAECPSVPGCTRTSVDPGACSNATCTAPAPVCRYQCSDGGTTQTGSCTPP